MKRSFSLWGGVLLTALPLAGLATGCGGGGGGVVNPTPTATTSATATTTPTTATATPTTTAPTSTSLGSAPVNFGNGQAGTIDLTRTGNNLAGTIVVNSSNVTRGRQTRSFNFLIAAATYQVSGTVDPLASPDTFNVTGNFPLPIGPFSITGTVPTTTAAGTYTISASGQTVSGTYPRLDSTTPTATPTTSSTATPTPTSPGDIGGSFNLSLTQTNDSNFGLTSFQPTTISGTRNSAGAVNIVAVNGGTSSQNRSMTINLVPGTTPLKVGDRFLFGGLGSPNTIAVAGIAGGDTIRWVANGGTLEITAISNTSISGTLGAVQLRPSSLSARGTLTFNGTFQAKLTAS